MSRTILLGAGLACAFAIAGCDAVVGAGDRKLNTTVTCTDKGCACAKGYGDCDKDPDNGCETDLSTPKHCGDCNTVCSNGQCDAMTLSCACQPGFAHCDGDAKGACETDLMTTSAHCGSCDRDCGDLGCAGGLCKPATINIVGGVYTFVIDGKTMYFSPANAPGVSSVSVDGGTPKVFAMDPEFVDALCVKDGVVYWGGETKVVGTTISTGQSVNIATGQIPAYRVGAAGGKVYWTNVTKADMSLSLRRASATGGGMPEDIVKLGDAKYIYDFALSDDMVFWNDVTAIMASPHDTLAPNLFYTVTKQPTFYQANASTLFFSMEPSGIGSVPFKGGSITNIADVPGYGEMAVDDKNIYFEIYAPGAADPPAIWRASLTGVGAPVKLVSDPAILLGVPIAVDDKWLYWVNQSQTTVLRVPK